MPHFEQKPSISDKFATITTATYSISNEPGTIFTNTGSAVHSLISLPTSPAPGTVYGFINIASVRKTMVVRAPGATIIQDGKRVNFLVCDATGAALTLTYNNSIWNATYNTAGQLGPGFVSAGRIGSRSSIIDPSTLSAWAWGSNNYGQLGNNTAVSKSSPVSVVGGKTFTAIAAGFSCSLALEIGTGVVWSWGRNSFGQLGDNTAVDKSSPVSVVGGKTFTKISTGVYQSIALDASGQAWTWGKNGYGQLGNNLTANTSSPVSVVGGKTFTQIASGTYQSLALDQNGLAWAWGLNSFGQLGDNTAINKSSPVSVVGGKTFTQIVGCYHSMALETNTGTVWAWGSNGYGELGDNSTVNQSSPVSVVGGRTFTAIAVGQRHSLALDQNGQAWAWGYNYQGQLGNNIAGNTSSPVSVVGGKTFTQIAANLHSSYALEAGTGVVWTWGWNAAGQLGNNATANMSSPVSVVRLFL